MKFITRNHRLFFFLIWFLINLIQAGTTGLFDDEAYYWIYSQFPAWGYFDHPPMIAWLIKAGYTLFPNELGVRLFIVLMNTATLFIIQKLTEKKNDFLFYAIAASIAVAQIGGIIAVPDIPLLFFVSLFFLLYRRFLLNTTITNSLLLGISIALMLYSKYHGILIVFFTLSSHPKLLSTYQTYLAAIVALLLFSPHLYWQYEHHFPSLQFHLFERNAVGYRFSFTTEYLLGQIALAGPLLGWLFIWSAIKHNPGSLTERAMKYSLVGIYLVFLISTLKGRAEANWTVPGFVGLIVLSHQYLIDKPSLSKWVYRLAPVTLLLVLLARVYMILNIPSAAAIGKDEFHENKMVAAAIKQKAAGLPVVFINSYQKPSKYWFYTKQMAFALNTPDYRRNNYNYWPVEDSLVGKPAYVIGAKSSLFTDSIPGNQYRGNGGMKIEKFFSFSKVQITSIREELINKELLRFSCKIQSPSSYINFFQQQPFDTSSVAIAIYDKRGDVSGYLSSKYSVKQITETEISAFISCGHQLSPGIYTARMAITSCLPGFPSLNSSSFKFEIK